MRSPRDADSISCSKVSTNAKCPIRWGCSPCYKCAGRRCIFPIAVICSISAHILHPGGIWGWCLACLTAAVVVGGSVAAAVIGHVGVRQPACSHIVRPVHSKLGGIISLPGYIRVVAAVGHGGKPHRLLVCLGRLPSGPTISVTLPISS